MASTNDFARTAGMAVLARGCPLRRPRSRKDLQPLREAPSIETREHTGDLVELWAFRQRQVLFSTKPARALITLCLKVT